MHYIGSTEVISTYYKYLRQTFTYNGCVSNGDQDLSPNWNQLYNRVDVYKYTSDQPCVCQCDPKLTNV